MATRTRGQVRHIGEIIKLMGLEIELLKAQAEHDNKKNTTKLNANDTKLK